MPEGVPDRQLRDHNVPGTSATRTRRARHRRETPWPRRGCDPASSAHVRTSYCTANQRTPKINTRRALVASTTRANHHTLPSPARCQLANLSKQASTDVLLAWPCHGEWKFYAQRMWKKSSSMTCQHRWCHALPGEPETGTSFDIPTRTSAQCPFLFSLVKF